MATARRTAAAAASLVALLLLTALALVALSPPPSPRSSSSSFLPSLSLLASSKEGDEGEEWTKELFSDVGSDILGSLAAFVTVCVASGGGIGGGGLLVPLYILVLQLDRYAIPLSKATIFGSAVSNLIVNWPKRHPEADRPLIAFDVTLMLEPTTLAGTVIGVLLNTLFPTWLITLLLIALLGHTSKKTLAKAMKAWKKETRELERRKEESANESTEMTASDKKPDTDTDAVKLLSKNSPPEDVNATEVRRQLEKERKAPPLVLALLVACWLTILLAALFKGGHGADSIVGMECGGFAFWATNLIAIGIMFLVTIIGGKQEHALWLHKSDVGYQFLEGDVEWDHKNVWYYPMLCTLAGIAAGLLGIGGGMVKGPLMLAMGVRSDVAAATSAFMILFTASATTLQFTILGMLRWDYTLWYGMIGFLGGYVGKKGLGRLIKRYERPSLVVFCLGGIIGLSCFVMGIVGIMQVVEDMKNEDWEEFEFHSLCTH